MKQQLCPALFLSFPSKQICITWICLVLIPLPYMPFSWYILSWSFLWQILLGWWVQLKWFQTLECFCQSLQHFPFLCYQGRYSKSRGSLHTHGIDTSSPYESVESTCKMYDVPESLATKASQTKEQRQTRRPTKGRTPMQPWHPTHQHHWWMPKGKQWTGTKQSKKTLTTVKKKQLQTVRTQPEHEETIQSQELKFPICLSWILTTHWEMTSLVVTQVV